MTSRSFQRFFPAFFCFSVCMSVHETHAAEQTWKQNREVMPAVTAEQSDEGTQDAFHVLDGYQVEKLFDVPRDDLGSWVSLTTDPQGRLYACDQQEKGLVRITPAALDGSTETPRVFCMYCASLCLPISFVAPIFSSNMESSI